MDPQFLSLMAATVRVTPKSGLDNFAQPIWGAPWTTQARVEPTEKRLLSAQDETVVDAVFVYMPIPAIALGDGDKVELLNPGGDTVTFGPILGVNTVWDEKAPHHLEVACAARPPAGG